MHRSVLTLPTVDGTNDGTWKWSTRLVSFKVDTRKIAGQMSGKCHGILPTKHQIYPNLILVYVIKLWLCKYIPSKFKGQNRAAQPELSLQGIINRNPWISMNMHEYAWISMNIHEYPWTGNPVTGREGLTPWRFQKALNAESIMMVAPLWSLWRPSLRLKCNQVWESGSLDYFFLARSVI